MIEYDEEHYDERYHSIVGESNNCADLTEETLAYGGIPISGDNQYHVETFFGLRTTSPEVPKFLFDNIIATGAGRLWQVRP